MKLVSLIKGFASIWLCAAVSVAKNSTFYNPVIAGWHSDGSCTRGGDTYYCTASTMVTFPALPIYASKDLVNWRLISHAWNRDEQLPGLSYSIGGLQSGVYAPSLRWHNDELFLIVSISGVPQGRQGVIFRAKAPFDDVAWGMPLLFYTARIDPDLFWDDDGKTYVATHGIYLQEIDLNTGNVTTPIQVWKGTGEPWVEAPRLYKRDGYYYLLIAEGGSGIDHFVAISRSRSIWGPYEAYENNPILTNRGTDEYFQCVGHADLFTDTNGKWWGAALAIRSGPQYTHYPMSRELVMFPVTWEDGQWPILEPVKGNMTGWERPEPNRDVPGDGPFNTDGDKYHFTRNSTLPKHFIHWRVPRENTYLVTDEGLRMIPSRNNVTGMLNSTDKVLSGQNGLSYIGRRQTHTIFHYHLDVTFSPNEVGQEAGISAFYTPATHIDLGITLMDDKKLYMRALVTGSPTSGPPPDPVMIEVPSNWTDSKQPIRLHIIAEDPETYHLAASLGCGPLLTVTKVSTAYVSDGYRNFVGTLLGAYATCNGAGTGDKCPEGGVPMFQDWTYKPKAQYIEEDVWVASKDWVQS